MATFTITVFGENVEVQINLRNGNGKISSSAYNEALPIQQFEIVNPGNLLTTCPEVGEAFEQGLETHLEKIGIEWVTEHRVEIEILTRIEEEIKEAACKYNWYIKRYNAQLLKLHENARATGIKSENIYTWDDQYSSRDTECLEIDHPQGSISFKLKDRI